MSAAIDNEVLDAFLVEAGELLDTLGDQLIALEADPHDAETLNSVFRAFHTVKGGAGFLAVRPMVELCHHAEDLLNEARNRRCELHPSHIDSLLKVLDALLAMMQALRDENEVQPAPPELMRQLQTRSPEADSAQPATSVSVVAPPATAKTDAAPGDEIEAAFVAMLEGANDAPASSDAISDDEFERLLDELHGGGQAPGAEPAGGKDAIDDSEFETLLDNIYGKGGAPGMDHGGGIASAPTANTETASPASAATTRPASPATETPAGARAARDAAEPHKHRADTTVRVDTDRIDALVNATGELVLVRNRLANLTARGASSEMERAVNNLDRVAGDLQAAVLRMRMDPVGRLFQRFPRIVRDLARQLGKQVVLEQRGEDTHLDRTLVESLADPLIHLLRNSVDHGIEDPDVRERAGKPRQGTVTLSAGQEGERVVIGIGDDGRGMDPGVLRRKAIEKQLLTAEQAERLTTPECLALIFRPGFSTRTEISDISGRGVGMDVVKTSVAALGGTIDIESTPGAGTIIRIGIPLTLAIMRVLMVRVADRQLALPLANVTEVFELDPAQLQWLDGRVVVAHRGRPLPLSDLAAWAGVEADADRNAHVVVVHVGHRQLGFVATEVFGREEVMVKPLGAHLQDLSGIAGATITGDGRIALVLDLQALAESPLPPPMRARA
ncbi:MAG: chemotaxis protein CheA [Xanthomonadales bacterium]|nr:chemotaxis protein CheA [Xanthomonadales bacterium]ODU95300.1 MAG: chemotaxis protein CheA [Rhodanobacter sp. SCN 66-43]OJY83026.1 MAG: chemotaxis protein CheA [Xanthomonadales bacterium 66-474]